MGNSSSISGFTISVTLPAGCVLPLHGHALLIRAIDERAAHWGAQVEAITDSDRAVVVYMTCTGERVCLQEVVQEIVTSEMNNYIVRAA